MRTRASEGDKGEKARGKEGEREIRVLLTCIYVCVKQNKKNEGKGGRERERVCTYVLYSVRARERDMCACVCVHICV